jgi:hypothetical protein
MAHNFQRPNLPYEADSLPNNKRYQLLTRSNNRPPTDVMLDTDVNYLIDAVRQLDDDIAGVEAGAIPGSDDLENANALVTTDGAGNIGWVKVQDSNIIDNSISRLKIVPQTITATEIQDGAITGDKLADGAVTNTELATNAVTTDKIAAGAVTNTKLATNAVTTGKIAGLAVTNTELATNAVTTDKIAAGAVTTAKIAVGAVTTSELGVQAVTTARIAVGAVTTAELGSQAVTAAKIANDTITFTQINSSFTATKAQQEAAASSSVYVSPARQQDHPSAASFWCYFDGTATGTNAPLAGYNVTSIQRISTGQYQINYTSGFSSTQYGVFPSAGGDGSNTNVYIWEPLNTNSCKIQCGTPSTGAVRDPAVVCVFGFGTLA